MKTKYIGLFVICLLLSGCSDFLTQTPETSPVLLDFFESKKDFKYAVTGTYTPMQDLYNNDYTFGLQSLRADNLTFIYDLDQRGATEIEDINLFTVKPTNSYVEGNWDLRYLVISRANQVLAALRKTQLNLSPSFKHKVKGQALFLRAFSYFALAREYQNIPLLLKPVKTYEEAFKPQAPAEKVYQQIISDAKKAASLLPNSWNKAGPRRASAAAAYTLLGTVYLTLEKYSNAEEALMNVVNMGYYGLLPDYADIFKPSNEGNREMIFVVEFETGFAANPQSSSFPIQLLPFFTDVSEITGIQQNRGNCCFGIAPTPDLIKAFRRVKTTDERFDASIGFFNGPSPVVGVPYDPIPYVKKYLHPHSNYFETDQNWPVYRYAQVLLMLSRAIYEQGGRLNEAKKYLNMVRKRAGINITKESNAQDFGKAILQAFRLEFAFENKRWYSLQRTGNAIEVMNALGREIKTSPVDYFYPPSITETAYFNGTYTVTKNSLTYPIPAAELNINPELTQNPGYR